MPRYSLAPIVGRAPVVASVTPSSGDAAGGTSVTIVGGGVGVASSVTIGGVAATITSRPSADSIVVTTGADGGGFADVVVTTPRGVATATNAFEYLLGFSVTGINPDHGSILGGTSVTITGTGFVDGDVESVTIDGIDLASFTVDGPTSISGVTGVAVLPRDDCELIVTSTLEGSASLPGAYDYT